MMASLRVISSAVRLEEFEFHHTTHACGFTWAINQSHMLSLMLFEELWPSSLTTADWCCLVLGAGIFEL